MSIQTGSYIWVGLNKLISQDVRVFISISVYDMALLLKIDSVKDELKNKLYYFKESFSLIKKMLIILMEEMISS